MKSSEQEEKRLREAFAKLKAVDARRAPSFHASSRAPAPRVLRPVWLLAAPVVAAAAVLVVMCSVPSPQSATVVASGPLSQPVTPVTPVAARLAIDPAPLDFLLEMRGTAFLGTVPDFDSDPVTKGRFR